MASARLVSRSDRYPLAEVQIKITPEQREPEDRDRVSQLPRGTLAAISSAGTVEVLEGSHDSCRLVVSRFPGPMEAIRTV